MSAAEDAVISLKNDLKAKIMRLPKPVSQLTMYRRRVGASPDSHF